MPNTHRHLRQVRFVSAKRAHCCVVTNDDEQFRAWAELPAIAHGVAEILAYVVVLGLHSNLHVRREVQRRVERADMDRNMAGRQTDQLHNVPSAEGQRVVGVKVDCGIRLQEMTIVESATLDIEYAGNGAIVGAGGPAM